MSHPVAIISTVTHRVSRTSPTEEDEMDSDDDDLCRCMEGMACGDAAFLFMFHERFGSQMAWVVRDIVRSMGRTDILRDGDEIDGLVIDACEVLFKRAGGWRPGGALPWNWARQAIRSGVAAGVGHRQVEFSDASRVGSAATCGSGVEGEASGPRADAADLTGYTVLDLVLASVTPVGNDLAAIVSADPRARLLDQAIRSVGHERSQLVCWQYGIQKSMGDPSPSITVGRMFGLNPGNVRQIYRRHKARVEALIEVDERFVSLREIGWFAA